MKYTEQYIESIVVQYDELRLFRRDHLKLYNALISRGEAGKKHMLHMKRGEFRKKPYSETGMQSKRDEPKKTKQWNDTTTVDGSPKPSHLFPVRWEGNTKHCGRCFRSDMPWSRNRTNLCKHCCNRIATLTAQGRELNPWNIRDQFANTIIRHWEKTFVIGLHAPDKLKDYLTLVGYGFIFKDIYDEKHLQSVLTPG